MKWILTLAIIGIFLLTMGCTGEEQTQSSTNATNQTTTTLNQPAQAGTNETTNNETLDVNSLGYAAIQALGMPVKCTYKDENGTANIYIKGNKYYAEITSQGTTYYMVMKDDKMYIKLQGVMKDSPGMESCDWLMFDTIKINEDSQTQAEEMSPTPDLETPDFSEQYDCAIDTFGDDKFDTPGTVCDYTEIMNQMIKNTDPCKAITDPTEKQECYESLGLGD